MTTKKDILHWYNTSVLPPSGTEELNKFMADTAVIYGAALFMPKGSISGLRYKNLSKALKAYERYNFTAEDILKMHPRHEELVANSLIIKALEQGK
jgi:hypothetical protein